MPRNADLVFDMRFLRNPYWDESLRDMTGLDMPVRDYVMADPLFDTALDQMEALLKTVLPRYSDGWKGLCDGRLRLYRRETQVSVRGGRSLRALAESGLFAHDLAPQSGIGSAGRV